MFNPMICIDGYKLDHRRQYPEGTEYVYSNFTPRGSRLDGVDAVHFVGLQYFIKRYIVELMEENFFARDVDDLCREYDEFMTGYLGPNDIGTDHIRALHNLGYVPLEFKALPEGTATPLRVPMFTVENTHPDFFWLVNYFETILSASVWHASTSATIAAQYRKLFDAYAEYTGSPAEAVNFQGHDFSFRGLSGSESASMSGIGHLTSFTGTDTIPSVFLINRYYDGANSGWIGASVAASEHSVACAGGKDNEERTFERFLDLYPSGIFSFVCDTWDYWSFLTNTIPKYKDRIMAREGKVVVRPDSGDPVKIICGDPAAPVGSPEYKGTVEVLWDEFGGTTTEKGYKLLDSHIGVIYGDSITYDRAQNILRQLEAKGFASGNVVFGIGSYTYQYVTRDTFGFAMKATWAKINGVATDMFKEPKTDNGVKISAKGRLAVLRNENDELYLVNQATPEQEAASELKTVWKDGEFAQEINFAQIRENVSNTGKAVSV